MATLTVPEAQVFTVLIIGVCYIVGKLINTHTIEDAYQPTRRIPTSYQEPLFTSITVPSRTNLEEFLKNQIRITEEQLRLNSDLGNVEQITILNQTLSLYKNMLTLHQREENAEHS